jgi:hypothetical protein
MEVHMIARSLVALGLVLGLAGAAFAGARISTPGITPPAAGELICRVTNLSDNLVEFATQIYDFDGQVVLNDASFTLGPKMSNGKGTPNTSARYCIITLLKGKKKEVRVNVEARDGTGTTTATLEGH